MSGLIMLVVFALYLLVAISVTSWLARIPKRVPYKWLTALLSLAVFALIPTWDEILGRMYFKHLCETEGGVRVYKTVELGPEYWRDDGTTKLITSSGDLNMMLLIPRFDIKRNYQDESTNLFHIRKTTELISEKEYGKRLGSYTYFIYFGGWLANSSGLHVTGVDCPSLEEASMRKLVTSVFNPISH